MKLGIDFGTIPIVVASVDRGNYPLCRLRPPTTFLSGFPRWWLSEGSNDSSVGMPGALKMTQAGPSSAL